MKKIISLAIGTFLLWHTVSYAQTCYSHQICVSPRLKGLIAATVSDLKQNLQKATGDSFTVNTKDSSGLSGICLIRLDRDRDSAFDSRLDRYRSDVFLIRSDGSHYLHIIAYTTDGLTNGIYTYLDMLGFRWFHPGDLWAHIPQLHDITMQIDSCFRPDFEMRSFFGSFGIPRNEVIDKTNYVHKQWTLWALRNRQGGIYNLRGHEWNNFQWANIDTLKAHPDYFALIDSCRNSDPKGGHPALLCLSNEGLRKLFVSYEVEKLKKDMATHPGQLYYYESVEPSDGGGACECENCQKMGTVSDRVFELANEVARAFRQISPIAGVNMLAYYTHAAVPSIPIEPNVLVEIIPYRFQKYTTPDSMIDAWAKKKDTLLLYDYYGLPILNLDMPLKGGLKPLAYARRVQSWYRKNIVGSCLETSCSIGATGLGLYLYTRLAWQINSDPAKLVDEYYQLNYGKAAQAMRRAQELLADDSMDNRMALYNTIHFITDQVNKKQLTPDELGRVITYEAYLHYLKLLYDFKRADHKTQEPMMTDTVMRCANSIFMRMLVSQYSLTEYMWLYGPSPTFMHNNWDIYRPEVKSMKFHTVVQWTDEQIEQAFREDYRQMRHALPRKDRALPGKPCCEDSEEDLLP